MNKSIKNQWRMSIALITAVLGNWHYGVSQKVSWPHYQNGNYLSSKMNNASISWGNTTPRLKNPRTNTFFTEYVGFNQQFDVNGNVLFTVISTRDEVFLFDKNNVWVDPGDRITGLSPEITIVPLKNGLIYHIMAAGKIWEYQIASNFLYKLVNEYGTYNLNMTGKTILSSRQAVRMLSDDICKQTYIIYSLMANDPGKSLRTIKVQKVVHNQAENSTDTILQEYNITSYKGITTHFGYEHVEMELSPDGSKLALVDDFRIFIYKINPGSGLITGVEHVFEYAQLNLIKRIAGIEFFNNENIYFSIFDRCNPSDTGRGIYHWNIGKPAIPVRLNASDNFSRSMIEKAKNGKLYTVKSDGLYEIITGTNKISLALSSSNLLIPRLDLHNTLFGVVCDQNNPIYYLPDQLDNQVNENLDLTEVVNTFTFKPGQTYNWSNSSHGLTPKGSGKVIVLNAINVPSNTSVTLDGMNIEFWTDAAFDVYTNSTVNLRGTVCQGTSCGQMWRGISLLSSAAGAQNNLYMRKNTAGKIAEIRDAYTGVKLISRFSRFEASENSSFSANEKHITLINTDKSYIKIENCYFNGSVPLKNPSRGSANGYADQRRRTITAIELVNSNVNIGNLSQPQNTIIGGQFGIDATGTILGLYRAECTGQKNYGVVFNANAVAGRTLWVEQCNLHDLYRGIRVSGKTQETRVYQNNFKNTSGYAVEYLDNPGGKLLVGDQALISRSNNFDNCNWAAIHCSNNAKYIDPKAINTDIQIYNNRINNHVYAAGIAVSEPTNAMRSYGIMKIMYNQMGTQKPIGQGVILKQIAGANPLLPLDRAVIKTPKSYFNQDFQVDSNVINYTNSFNAFYRGIWAEISTGQNYRNNTVTANSTGDWRPSAIRISDGKNNLLTENILHAGNGLQVTGDGMFSNYYCNTFNTCVIGIQLSWNFLRNRPPLRNFLHNDALYHAHMFDNKVFGRPNTYNSTISWGSDIHVYTNTIDRNLWDFNNNIVPKISYLSPTPRYPNGIVNNKLRLNLCNAEIIKDKDKDKDNDSSEIKLDLSMVDYASESNAVLQWKLKYGIARSNVSGLTHQTIGDSAINDLVSIEMAIQNRDYALAAAELNVYQPTNAIESDFKTAYSIWVHNRLGLQWHSKGLNHLRTDTLWTDSAEFVVETVSRDSMYQVAEYPELSDSLVNILSGIAAQDATLVNPAAYPARAILWAEKHLLFEDAPIEHWPNITGVVNSACTNNANAIVKLFHENGTYTGISAIADSAGFFFIDGGLLRHLDSHLNYYIEVRWPDSSTAVSPTARWKQLAYTSSHWLNCSSQATQLQFMGVSKNTLQELILYPNPGNGSFTLSSLPENWYLCLYDPTGRLMLSKRSSDRQYTHAEPLPGGVYLIKLTDTKTGQSVMKKYVAY
jgi:hypothetical protein